MAVLVHLRPVHLEISTIQQQSRLNLFPETVDRVCTIFFFLHVFIFLCLRMYFFLLPPTHPNTSLVIPACYQPFQRRVCFSSRPNCHSAPFALLHRWSNYFFSRQSIKPFALCICLHSNYRIAVINKLGVCLRRLLHIRIHTPVSRDVGSPAF
jgi:hypothetical protein